MSRLFQLDNGDIIQTIHIQRIAKIGVTEQYVMIFCDGKDTIISKEDKDRFIISMTHTELIGYTRQRDKELSESNLMRDIAGTLEDIRIELSNLNIKFEKTDFDGCDRTVIGELMKLNEYGIDVKK